MRISPSTSLVISVASRPGSFGATVYNELFAKHRIDAIYLPRPAPASGEMLIDGLRALSVAGCSVSNPLKGAVPSLLDELDPLVAETNSCNTIAAVNHRLLGFNTDVVGFREALLAKRVAHRSVLIYGYGSVVNSLVAALRSLGSEEILLTGRRSAGARAKAEELGLKGRDHGSDQQFDLLVNATPISADAAATEKIFAPLLKKAEFVFDLMVSPRPTALAPLAESAGKKFVPGLEMAKHQLQQQFFHYFSFRPDLREIEQIIREKYEK